MVTQALLTLSEYLELEQKAEVRSEYINGEITPMPGSSVNHHRIAGTLLMLLKIGLRGQDFFVAMGDMRLGIPQANNYTYPDLMVVSGEPMLFDNDISIVTNPCLIIEVLSRSTSDYDKGDKFDRYRSIPEFTEYVLVSQYQYHIIHYVKVDRGWLLTETSDLGGNLHLQSIDLDLSLADIYEQVSLTST